MRRVNRGKGFSNKYYRTERIAERAWHSLIANLMRGWKRVYILS